MHDEDIKLVKRLFEPVMRHKKFLVTMREAMPHRGEFINGVDAGTQATLGTILCTLMIDKKTNDELVSLAEEVGLNARAFRQTLEELRPSSGAEIEA